MHKWCKKLQKRSDFRIQINWKTVSSVTDKNALLYLKLLSRRTTGLTIDEILNPKCYAMPP